MFKIKDKYIGENNPCYIIAEMSANHCGDFKMAKDIIYNAKESGADCIKIQTYTPDTMTLNCDNKYFKIKHGLWKGQNLYELYKTAYTPWEWQVELKKEAEKNEIDFLSTPFDKTSVDFLEDIGLDFYKIASFELTDIPLIEYIAATNKPIILSTGMGTLDEINEAVAAIKKHNNKNICLLKCSSDYPADLETMNLATIKDLKMRFSLEVGLSDHSMGTVSSVTAVAIGAKVIEKHFCLSRNFNSADSEFSMEPLEFKKLVNEIREVEKVIGKVDYTLSEKEYSNRIFRRSMFANSNIKKGQMFTNENIRIVRPANGLEPKYLKDIVGKIATEDIEFGTPINWDMINDREKSYEMHNSYSEKLEY